MAMQNLLLSSDLIFIALTFVTAISYDMSQFIKPYYYDINLTLYTEESHYMNSDLYKVHRWYIEEQHARNNSIFYAEFYIIFQVTQEIQEIRLHANNLHVCASSQLFDKETYNDEKLQKEIKWSRCLVYNEAQIIIFEFDNKIKPGTYILKIKYVGAITNYVGGIFRTSYINENGDKTWLFAAGNFLPPEIRQVFPCWDKPSINILIQSISIRNHQNYTVLTGLSKRMPPKQIENDMVQSHFLSKGSMSIYHVTFVVSQLYNAFNENQTVNMWCRKLVAQHVIFAQSVAKNVITYVKGYNLVIHHVAIPGFRNEGTDSSDLILYSEAAITYDEKSDPLSHKIEVARLIGYKIIRYLLDCTRYMSSWSDLWIIEGVAIFYGAYVIDKIIPNIPQIMDLFVVQAKYETLLWDAYNDMPLELQDDALSKMKSIWFYPRYLKAFLLMRILQYVMTDKVFYKAVQRLYFNIQLYKRYDDKHFWNDMQKVYRDTYLNRKLNLIEAFSGWTKQRHYPVLNVRRNYTTNDVMIELQNNFNISYQNNYWIPVTYVTQSSPIFNNNLSIYWLKPEQPCIRLNVLDDGWIIVNVQQAGYYRVHYDIINWRKIIYYIYNNDNYVNIHALNRAQIVDDVYYFLSTNEFDYSAFKFITGYLSQEMDYVVWYPMFKNMERMSSFFAFRESTELKGHLREVLNGLMLKIKYKEDSDDSYHTKCLRQEAAKWACILGSVVCRNMAMTKMNQHLANHEAHKLSSWWKEWAYCAGLTTVNSITWMQMLTETKHLLEYDNKILEHLTCTTDPDNIKNYLRILVIRHYDALIQNNQPKIFLSIIAKHVNNDKVLEFILSHFQQIKSSKISTIVALISIIDHVYDESQLQQIRESEFVRNNLSKIFPHVQRKIEQRLFEINNQMNFWVYLRNT